MLLGGFLCAMIFTALVFGLLSGTLSAVSAAALDGARARRLFLNIDLPLMLPAIGITFFIRFIDSFRVFDNLYTLVGPGAGGSTTSMSIYIYQAFFKVGDIGLAVAASMLLLAASFVVLLAINWLTARKAPL